MTQTNIPVSVQNETKSHILQLCHTYNGLRDMVWPNPTVGGGGGGVSSVGRARDSWWGDLGFDSRSGRPLPRLLVGSVSVYCDRLRQKSWCSLSLCGSTLNCQTLCLGARPRYNLVVDEDVKKPTKQTNNPTVETQGHYGCLEDLQSTAQFMKESSCLCDERQKKPLFMTLSAFLLT